MAIPVFNRSVGLERTAGTPKAPVLPTGAGFNALTRLGEQAAAAASEQHARVTAASRAMNLKRRSAEAKSAFAVRFNERAADAQGHATLAQDAQSIFDEIAAGSIVGAEDDEQLVGELHADLSTWFVNQQPSIQSTARKQAIGQAKADTQETLRFLRQRYAQGDASALAEIEATINTAEELDVFSPQESQRLRADEHDATVEAALQTQILSDPAAVAEALAGGAFSNIDPKLRARLQNQADTRARVLESERLARIERAERQMEKALEERQKENSFEMLVALMNPEEGQPRLTEDQVRDEVRRRNIDPAQGARLMRAVDAELGVDDPDYVNSIEVLIDDGEDAQQQILLALDNGHLSSETMSKLLRRNRAEQDTPNPEKKQARQFLRKSLTTKGPMSLDLGGQNELIENAMLELEERFEPGQGITVAREILGRARDLISPRETLLVPRFGGSKSGFDRARLTEAASATFAAFEDGTITQDELDRQTALFDQWDQALTFEEQAQARRSAKQ